MAKYTLEIIALSIIFILMIKRYNAVHVFGIIFTIREKTNKNEQSKLMNLLFVPCAVSSPVGWMLLQW